MTQKLTSTGLSRRGILKTALATAGAAAVGGGTLLGTGTGMAAKGGKGGGGGATTRNPLYVPPVVSPGSFDITAAPS